MVQACCSVVELKKSSVNICIASFFAPSNLDASQILANLLRSLQHCKAVTRLWNEHTHIHAYMYVFIHIGTYAHTHRNPMVSSCCHCKNINPKHNPHNFTCILYLKQFRNYKFAASTIKITLAIWTEGLMS